MSCCADCGCKCGMRTQCGNENCVCACHEFDHMHCWQYVALCKTCKPDLNVSELKGLSRNDLFSYISFHMTRVEFNKLYDNRLSWFRGQKVSKCDRVPENVEEFLHFHTTHASKLSPSVKKRSRDAL